MPGDLAFKLSMSQDAGPNLRRSQRESPAKELVRVESPGYDYQGSHGSKWLLLVVQANFHFLLWAFSLLLIKSNIPC